MDIESTITVLRRKELLLEHAPHSVQFQMGKLPAVFSTAAVIPSRDFFRGLRCI